MLSTRGRAENHHPAAASTDDPRPEAAASPRSASDRRYFFEFYTDDSKNNTRDGAATGALVAVEPGERVRTTFSLSDDGEVWTLTMAVVDQTGTADPARTSEVVATKPFMGLLDTTESWTEYNTTRAGSCWEDYGLEARRDYPQSGWVQNVTIEAVPPYFCCVDMQQTGRGDAAAATCGYSVETGARLRYDSPWTAESISPPDRCDYTPRSTVSSTVSGDVQLSTWTLRYPNVPNDYPIVGVLTVPLGAGGCETVDAQGSCFQTMYAKYVEGAGGRVVPIPSAAAPESFYGTFLS